MTGFFVGLLSFLAGYWWHDKLDEWYGEGK